MRLVMEPWIVRLLHLLAVALVVGGAFVAAAAMRKSTGSDGLIALARAYEAVFWVGVGLAVMTGVGNLAVAGGRIGPWSIVMGWKLAVIGLLILFSMVRTLVVAQAPAPSRLAKAYALTAGAFTIVLAMGVWLAHA